MNLRKAKKLEPELLARVAPPVSVETIAVKDVVINELPTANGLYQFFISNQSLYVGEAANLRVRLKKHLDHSDNKGLARWMWEFGQADLFLEIQVLEDNTTARIRRALETELICSRRPTFNVQR